jgi:hypothetical protein
MPSTYPCCYLCGGEGKDRAKPLAKVSSLAPSVAASCEISVAAAPPIASTSLVLCTARMGHHCKLSGHLSQSATITPPWERLPALRTAPSSWQLALVDAATAASPAASRFRFSTPYIPKVPFPFQREGARDGGRVVWPVDLCGTGPPGQVYRPDCTTTQARSFSDTPPPLDCSCRALHTTASEVAHGANQIP